MSERRHSGDGDNEKPPPLPYVMQLAGYFIFEIPRKYNHIIGFSLSDFVGMINGYVGARQESALFVRATVHSVFNHVLTDPTVMK